MKLEKEVKFDFGNLYEILDFIEKKHFLLLKPKLELLYTYISGIEIVSYDERIEIKNIERLEEFNKFVHQKMALKHENTMGWYGAIAKKYGKEREGFDKFFEYLHEFRNEKQNL